MHYVDFHVLTAATIINTLLAFDTVESGVHLPELQRYLLPLSWFMRRADALVTLLP
jgi:hypothetical protein